MYVQELTSPLCLWCIGEHHLYPGRLSISIQSIHVSRASGNIDTHNGMFTGHSNVSQFSQVCSHD